ncbi:type VI secretion system Vgr family protein [Thermodesulfobacteriota bacterium B35]
MANTEDRIRFRFISAALAEDAFTLVRFSGREGLSQLYEFDIILDAEDPEIDLKAVLRNPARLVIEREDADDRVIHGIPARFEQMHEVRGHVYYRAVLVPRLWLSDLYHENQLFLDKSVPEIIEEILKQAALTSRDYEFRLTGSYPAWEYICQYNETDFNFISRWMEREGIYYFFDQTDEGEKLIITDSATAHQDISGNAGIRYSPPDSLIPTVREQVREFTCRQQVLPKKVVLKDYNYRKPSLDLKGEADVDPEGRGTVYIYGEHFKTPEQGNGLARIRAEELLCRETVYYGEGTVPPFLTGYIFELEDHYRDSFNRRYLITELTHEGVQANFLIAGGDDQEEIQTPSYYNRFVCIPDDVQFRPERRAVRPRLDSTLNAHVDAAGDGQYAEIDDQGRYKIRLPFDQSGAGGGKASRWIRMAQPYAGADYGMHFPLHKGTEVVLTFVNGDPDRPIIAGTVPNPETASPITAGSHTKSRIRTAASNEIMLEDQQGSEMIYISTPHSKSRIYMGAAASPPGIRSTTEGQSILHGESGIYLNAWTGEYHDTGNASQYMSGALSLAGTIATAASAAGAGTLEALPVVLSSAATIQGLAAPGILLSAPSGISAITPSTFAVAASAGAGLFSLGPADIMAAASASVMGGGGVNVFAVSGGLRCIAGGGDVDVHARKKDVNITALANVKVQGKTENIEQKAGKNIVMTAEAEDIRATAGKNVIVSARENNIGLSAKNEVDIVAEKEASLESIQADVTVTAGRKILHSAESEIVLSCGDSSIVLKDNGRIDIKGKTVNISASIGAVYVKGPTVDIRASAANTIKGNPVMIN